MPSPSDEDFRAIALLLKALERVKATRMGERPWSDASELVEEALEALEHARSYLFAGELTPLASLSLTYHFNPKRQVFYAYKLKTPSSRSGLLREFAAVIYSTRSQLSPLVERQILSCSSTAF
jgi:hypothetical protein